MSIICIVQSLYEKTPLTYKKLQEKVFHLILLDIGVLYNILKVYKNRTGGESVFFKMAAI